MAKKPAKQKKPPKQKQPYGIGEWFGRDYVQTTRTERAALVTEAMKRTPDVVCRFRDSFPVMAPLKKGRVNVKCTKLGGVCCLRRRLPDLEGAPQYGPLVTTCPARFLEDGLVFSRIAQEVLSAARWMLAKEIDFLDPNMAPPIFSTPAEAYHVAEEAQVPSDDAADTDKESRSVGKIDVVLAAVDDEGKPTGDWCAVELQAVYFSGDKMSEEWSAIRVQAEAQGEDNMPPIDSVRNRRPDFRSSGPKRLLPQLQIKVPSLRRWGRKMAVVVDGPFFSTFGPMQRADHVSNADIIWCVVGYMPGTHLGLAQLCVLGTYMTTLEEAVTGLTAGKPRSKPDFENSLRSKLGPEIF